MAIYDSARFVIIDGHGCTNDSFDFRNNAANNLVGSCWIATYSNFQTVQINASNHAISLILSGRLTPIFSRTYQSRINQNTVNDYRVTPRQMTRRGNNQQPGPEWQNPAVIRGWNKTDVQLNDNDISIWDAAVVNKHMHYLTHSTPGDGDGVWLEHIKDHFYTNYPGESITFFWMACTP
jgi:hypothetical protein